MFDLLQMKWFPAGHGAALNADGDVELDAIILNGKKSRFWHRHLLHQAHF